MSEKRNLKTILDYLTSIGGRYEVIGRENEILHLAACMMSQYNDIAFLIGNTGVGRGSVVEGLINSLSLTTGKMWFGYELLLSVTQFDAWSTRDLQNLLNQIAKKENCILHIKNDCHAEMPYEILSDIYELKQDFPLNIVISLTQKQYTSFTEKHPALEGIQKVFIDVLADEHMLSVVKKMIERNAQRYSVEFEEGVDTFCLDLAKRYDRELPLLPKVNDLLDNTAALMRLTHQSNPTKAITKEHISSIAQGLFNLSEMPGYIPFSDKLNTAENQIKTRVFGQDAAIDKVIKSLKRASVGLKKPSRPIGVFMLVGWSGTGKTELAKAICEALYGSEDHLIRIDMSGYSNKEAAWTLTGSARGYKDSDAGGVLTEPMFKNPYRVVLFDEIEKSARETMDLFLQVFDDGRLADGRGNVADFSKSVIIMTSNQGTDDLVIKEDKGTLGFFENDAFKIKESEKTVLDSIKRNFRPELINRIDSIIFFDKLGDDVLAKICHKQFSTTKKMLLLKGINLEWDAESIIPMILEKTDRSKAGRGVEVAFAEYIQDFLTDKILIGELKQGNYLLSQSDGMLKIS